VAWLEVKCIYIVHVPLYDALVLINLRKYCHTWYSPEPSMISKQRLSRAV